MMAAIDGRSDTFGTLRSADFSPELYYAMRFERKNALEMSANFVVKQKEGKIS
jgi:hypothetical protein